MCDLQHIKACKWLCMSLVLLFAVLPAKLEARPRITTNLENNLLDIPIPTGEENDHEVTFIKPLDPEGTDFAANTTASKNYKSQILTVGINQTHNSEITTESEISEDTLQQEEDFELTDYPIDHVQTSTFPSVGITSSDKISVPFDFPSEKKDLFTILYATDFPILTRKLRGENLGYFQNPIESTDLTYSHVPIEFPIQAHSGIQILHSKDHPAFTIFFKNENEKRSLDLNLEESSGDFGEESDDQENSDSATTESVTGMQEVNLIDTTEPTWITDTLYQERISNANSDIFKGFIEPNSENQLQGKNEGKTKTFSDDFISTTKSYRNIVDVLNTENLLNDFSTQKRSTGISNDERIMYTTKIMEIRSEDFLNTLSPEERSTKFLTTMSTVPQQSIVKSADVVLDRTFKDYFEDVSSLTQNPLSLNPDKLIEEYMNIRSILPTERSAFTTHYPGFQSVYPINSENPLKILKTNAESKILSREFSTDLSVKDNANLSLNGDGSRKLSKYRLLPVFQAHTNSEADLRLTEENSNVPTETSADTTVSEDEILQMTKEIDGLTKITLSMKYPENNSSERSVSSSFESTTLKTDIDMTITENSPDLFELKNKADMRFEEHDELNSINSSSSEKLLSGEVYRKLTNDLNSESQNLLLRILIQPSNPIQDITLIADATFDELELKHTSKNSEKEIKISKPIVYSAESKSVDNPKFEKVKTQNTKDYEGNIDRQLLGIKNNLQNKLQNISENSKTEINGCCTSVNEKEKKIISEDTDTQHQVLITKTKLDEEQIGQTSELSNYETTEARDYTIDPIEESNAQRNYGEWIENNDRHNFSNDGITIPKAMIPERKVQSFQSNDESKLYQLEIVPHKQPKVFAASKEAHPIQESPQSEEHVNQFDVKETSFHLNRPITKSSESIESYDISYFLPEKRLRSSSIYQGRAFPDASEYFTEHLQPFKETNVQKSMELASTNHRLTKKPGTLATTLSPFLFTEETSASLTELEGTQSSKDDATSTTQLSFTDIILEAAELTTELNHEIESFRTTDETSHSGLEENVAAIGSTFSAEFDTYNLGDASPTHDMTKTFAADISLSIILMICMVGIFVVFAVLVTIWYKMRYSGNTFDIQLEEQRHRKEPDSLSISVSK